MKYFLLFILIMGFLFAGFSQDVEFVSDTSTIQKDSVVKKRKSIFKKGHDPAKAALFSAILPGAGQFYNKKYWKIPVVYVGIGGLSAWMSHNIYELNNINSAYRTYFDGDSTTNGYYKNYSTQSQLSIKRKEYKRNLDISAIALGIWYVLNIIDATVDAHLIYFDVNQDISISLAPDIRMRNANSFNLETNIQAGVSMRVHFK